MLYGVCEKCGQPVKSPEQPAFPVTGWEVLRGSGGANAIRLRTRVPDRVRHVSCLPIAADGQASLFPATPKR